MTMPVLNDTNRAEVIARQPMKRTRSDGWAGPARIAGVTARADVTENSRGRGQGPGQPLTVAPRS